MKTLIFATTNIYKLNELREMLKEFEVLGLRDLGLQDNIPETGSTLEENALIKAQYLFKITGLTSLAEDTGLEVEALLGAPGVHTARYAGLDSEPDANMDLLLYRLTNQANRSAQFRTVIAYVTKNSFRYFEGVVHGTIATQKSGTGGFGYDPIFIPDGYDKSFAALPKVIKNNISHRARAVQSLTEFLSHPHLHGINPVFSSEEE